MPAPSIPMNVVLQSGNGQNYLLWNQAIGATSYNVQRSVDNITWSTIGSPTTTNYLDSAVSVGTAYFYQVAAVNGTDVSPYAASYPASITPCLPGQINLSYIRYLAQLRADKLNSEYLTIDEWNSNINQLCFELYDILVSKFGDNYFLAPPLQINLTGAISYPLPDGALYSAAPALYKLSGVDVNIGGGGGGPLAGWVPVPRANWSDRDRWTIWPGQPVGLNNAYTSSYRVMGNNLFVFPLNSNQQLRLWYVPMMTMLLQETDMLPFSISGWSEYVIVRAAMLAMSKETSSEKYAILERQLATQIERIETQAANRDVDQPNSVQNVRQVMNDPGFGFGFGGTSGIGGGFGGGGLGY